MHAVRIEMLQRMPIFGAIRDDTLTFLLERARSVEVQAGDYFCREGDEAQTMYVLERGRAAVIKRWKGLGYVLHYLAEGDCFGEMALMDLCPRSASVRAEADCAAIELSAEHLYHLAKHDLEQFALIQMNMGREVSRRLRSTDEMLFRVRMGEALPGAGGLARAA